MRQQDIFTVTRKNIICMSLGIVVGTLLIFSVVTECIYRSVVFKAADEQLLTHKNMILNDAHISYENEEVKGVILPAPLVKELINYVWQNGRLIKDSPHPYEGTTAYPIFPENADPQTVYLIEDGGQYYRGIQFSLKDCTVQLLVSVNTQMASMASLRKALLKALAILLVITLLLAFYLASVALRPLNQAYEKMAHFIQDASHEMRTPLAVIKGKLELMARKGNETISEHYEELGMMMSEISGLEKMNKDLLLLSKEDMPCLLSTSEVYLMDFIKELTDFYKEAAQLRKIHFAKYISDGEVQVRWDCVRVKRCLAILLDNAMKYTPPKGSMTLRVYKQDRFILCSVEDTGYGIKEEELPHIFDRFYRSGEIRGRQIEGSGIGLSLLQSLAKTMHIKVKVQSQYGRGSTFTLTIPIKM